MNFKNILIIVLICFTSCSKNKVIDKEVVDRTQAYKIYEEGYNDMLEGQLFIASKKFSEAEKLMINNDHAAQSALMSLYCLYTINFFDEAVLALDNFLRKYPANSKVEYAEYMYSIIYYEKILDKTKDLEPLLIAKEKINYFLKKYPEGEYSIDLKFKLDLINTQLAAKELYIAKYYIKTQKWIPAINRLKLIVENYDQTVFVEEALHRLVEIYYRLGLTDEAKAAASILGYNYNSSEWYENSYKVLNKDYKLPKFNKKKDSGLLNRIKDKVFN